MAVTAATAIREWINTRPGLTGPGNPLSRGAYLDGEAIRSPAHGAYALLVREPGTTAGVVAEDTTVAAARITAHIKAGTIQAAEAAATALCNAFQTLTGCPEPCGSTGITVLVAGNFAEPGYVAVPGSGGEQFEFTTGAEFILTARLGGPPMAALTPVTVSRAGAVPAVITPAAGGDTFPAGPNTYVRFITAGTAITVTITPPAGGGPLGTTVAPTTIVLPATGVREYGPWPQYPFGDQNGNVTMTYSAITGLTLEVKNYAG